MAPKKITAKDDRFAVIGEILRGEHVASQWRDRRVALHGSGHAVPATRRALILDADQSFLIFVYSSQSVGRIGHQQSRISVRVRAPFLERRLPLHPLRWQHD